MKRGIRVKSDILIAMTSKQIVVGCPKGFDLLKCLDSAAFVKLAMAFAKRSGWAIVQKALLSCNTKIKIVVGLNFGITDPDLLSEWLDLCGEMPTRFEVRVAPQIPVFHPKVIIVRQNQNIDSSIAIVGSGNLTGGGQRHNVECGVYLDGELEIRELEAWYDGLRSVPLKKSIIGAYRPLYERAGKPKTSAVSFSRELAAALNEGQSDWYEDRFLDELTDFLSTPDGIKELKARINGAKKVRNALQMPLFSFKKADWVEFYGTYEFGSIRQTHPEMAEQVSALQRTFRFLLAKPLDVPRLRSVLDRDGGHHVLGLGMNQISKVLTVSDRRQWPLLNDRVWTTLFHFGYRVKWSAIGYLDFAQDMRRCLGRVGAVDFWALDAFCETKSREID